MSAGSPIKPVRALFSVTDKTGIAELARAMQQAGIEIVATGGTARVLTEAGVSITEIEKISGAVEAFQGRMKTLTFNVCSGILFRRDDAQDLKDARELKIPQIDIVVVNFYAFDGSIEKIDIGGPTLVRAAAKNVEHVLVLTDPAEYPLVIAELQKSGTISQELRAKTAASAWDHVLQYDAAIAAVYGARKGQTDTTRKALRYGENPHQTAHLEIRADSPLDWSAAQSRVELSYNNILDLSAAYELVSDLRREFPEHVTVVVFKHFNPCGVAVVSRRDASALKTALLKAWEGDPVSAFGGVLVFSEPLEAECAEWLASRFVDVVAYPGAGPDHAGGAVLLKARKNLKLVSIKKWGQSPREQSVRIPGGTVVQSTDQNPATGFSERFQSVTEAEFGESRWALARFGVQVCRMLKSNAVAIVREIKNAEGFQLVGTGQGQPNRVQAIAYLAIPRARAVCEATGGTLDDCMLISDAFFPFRDGLDTVAQAGIKSVVQPGGSVKDAEVIQAANENGVAMAFTGVRHFRH